MSATRRDGRLKRTAVRDGKRVLTVEWKRVRVFVEDRAQGRCEARCGDECQLRGNQAHHVLRRSQGGPDDPSNLLWVCAWCHGWIHNHPAISYERGWLRRSGAA